MSAFGVRRRYARVVIYGLNLIGAATASLTGTLGALACFVAAAVVWIAPDRMVREYNAPADVATPPPVRETVRTESKGGRGTDPQRHRVPELPMATWQELLAAYPWLGRLDTDLIERLDLAELADPHACAVSLGPTVVAYRRHADPSPGRVSLCSVVPAAEISPDRVAVLVAAERSNPGIVLVEYAPDE